MFNEMLAISSGGGGGESRYADKTVTPSSAVNSCSWNFSDVPNFLNLTTANFSLVNPAFYIFATDSIQSNITYNYNPTTGVFTATLSDRYSATKFGANIGYTARCSI